MVLFAATIFLSAFLLFLVQPLIARVILPWFGGSAAVWTTCLMFFQITLLGGYSYAHATIRWLRPKTQATLHMVLLAASILLLPILPSSNWKPADASDPAGRIVILLAVTVGAPYLLLSTTGPLLQAWFARHYPDASPYRLYALSNAGSLIALLSYPALVEPLMHLRTQAYVWSATYCVFAVLCAIVALKLRTLPSASPAAEGAAAGEDPERLSTGHYLLWIGLAFCPSVMLVAVTSHLTQNISPVPLFWVVPLSLYLLSFILTFESERWYGRRFWFPLFVFAVAFMLSFLFPDNRNAGIRYQGPVFTAGFFICAMTCHGELSRLKPPSRWLTSFYLMVSLGGALGGLFVGVIAPLVFKTYLELPVALLVMVVLMGIVLPRSAPMFPGPHARYVEFALIGSLCGGLFYLLAWEDPRWISQYREVRRNFYGVVYVTDVAETAETEAVRELHHGTISHGMEFLRPDLRRRPTTYYGPRSAVGIALRVPRLQRKVGVIGLGAGTISAYARRGDTYRFYDINPAVAEIARNDFYFLRECPATLEIVLGDARLSLEREPAQHFDVLAVDAFSGDSIPTHLLTLEAFREYFRHLNPDGLLLMHVSNRFLKLGSVVVRAARTLHKKAIYVSNPDDNLDGVYSSDWIVLANREQTLAQPQWTQAGVEPLPDPSPDLWTDDYSNLLNILK
jgi:spermidine synthase